MPKRTAPGTSARWPLTRRWTAVLVLLAVVFVALRGVAALSADPEDTAIYTPRVVVVGSAGHFQLSATDRAVLGARLDGVQVGMVSVRPRYVGNCAAAGWATLGAGRRASVGELCDPKVAAGRVAGWGQYQSAVADRHGDARLGTLAASVPGCVAAVGPGAALAAARPDGTLARYTSVSTFLATGALSCPVTLVDAGAESDRVVARYARQPDVTLLVTGIGPPPGSSDPQVQVIYRVGTTLPGWLTSTSTRRTGLVTLADLTRTLVDFGRGDAGSPPLPLDGAPLQVDQDTLTLPAIQAHRDAVTALSDAAVTGYLVLGAGGALLFGVLVASLLRRRLRVARGILAFGSVLGAAMMLTGAVPWSSAAAPGLALSLAVWGWSAVLTAVALLLSRRLVVPVAVAAAALTVAALTTDAALGAVMQAGSMLNSRPVAGARWYGFGNVTFSVYAASGLVLAGYLAHRFRQAGHRRAALTAVALVGFGIVVCEGWPTMGTDFGGVIALTPGVLWLLLVLSGVRVTWPRLAAVAGAAVLAISLISYLDWLRGAAARTHLGNFVQRILDGDAVDVVYRKAVASVETIVSPLGIGCLVVGIPLWVVLFRFVLPALVPQVGTISSVAVAALATAVLGTVLNDGGISVWLTLTSLFAVMVASLWVDASIEAGRLIWARRRSR